MLENSTETTLNLSGPSGIYGWLPLRTTYCFEHADIDILACALKHNTKLRQLDLSNHHIGDRGAAILAEVLEKNRTIRALNLRNNQIGDRGIKALRTALERKDTNYNTTLQFLDVGEMKGEDWDYIEECLRRNRGFEVVRQLKEGESQAVLSLANKNLGNWGLEFLVDEILEKERNIRKLDLSGNQIQWGMHCFAQRVLANHQSLEELDLSHNQIGDDEVKELAKALEGNQTLLRLNLGNNCIREQGVFALVSALEKNKILQELELESNSINIAFPHCYNAIKDIGAYLDRNKGASFAKRLREVQEIEINFSNQKIGYYGIQKVAEALKQNRSLRALSLSSDNLGLRGIVCLAPALQENQTLWQLDLSDNQLGMFEGVFLLKALENHPTLTHLNLCSNQIGNAGTTLDQRAFAKVLQRNQGLRRLDLRGNRIGHREAQMLLDALRQNITLQELDLRENLVDEETLMAIQKCLTRNKGPVNVS